MSEVIALPDETLPEHSPLGASSAERWMNCPGSVALIRALKAPEGIEEPEYRARGTAAHSVIERSLKASPSLQAWELIGERLDGIVIDTELALGAQVFLDEVERLRAAAGPGYVEFVEFRISSPRHKFFYGRLDYTIISADGKRAAIRDYKNGVGVVVEVDDNPQVMYYAYGILKDHPNIEEFDLGIVQPNAFHPGGPVRSWRIDAEYIRDWSESSLFPAMERASLDEQPFLPGAWCRFCPAKIVCPSLKGMFKAAALSPVKAVPALSDADLALDYALVDQVKAYVKALEEEVFTRLNHGSREFQGVAKLVTKKANRVFKPEAPFVFSDFPGAFTQPELKSPAELEALGPDAKKLVREWAFTPESGLTVAGWSDKRVEQVATTVSETFGKFVGEGK